MGSCMSSNSGDGGVSAQPKSKSKTKAFQGTVSVSCVLVWFLGRSKPMLRSESGKSNSRSQLFSSIGHSIWRLISCFESTGQPARIGQRPTANIFYSVREIQARCRPSGKARRPIPDAIGQRPTKGSSLGGCPKATKGKRSFYQKEETDKSVGTIEGTQQWIPAAMDGVIQPHRKK